MLGLGVPMSVLKQMVSFGLLVSTAVALTGCRELKVENGELPAEYVEAASRYMGEYSGSFDGKRGQIRLQLEGRKVIFEFRDSRGGRDLLPGCDAIVGQLESAAVQEKSDGQFELMRVSFALDPGSCWSSIRGRELELRFHESRSGKIGFDLYLFHFTIWQTRCVWFPGDPARKIPPHQQCYRESLDHFLKGRFSR